MGRLDLRITSRQEDHRNLVTSRRENEGIPGVVIDILHDLYIIGLYVCLTSVVGSGKRIERIPTL